MLDLQAQFEIIKHKEALKEMRVEDVRELYLELLHLYLGTKHMYRLLAMEGMHNDDTRNSA